MIQKSGTIGWHLLPFSQNKTKTNTNKQNVDSCSPDQPEVLMRVRVRAGQDPLFSFFDHSVIKMRRKLMKMDHTNVIYCTHIQFVNENDNK